jgi:hypothetical protein
VDNPRPCHLRKEDQGREEREACQACQDLQLLPKGQGIQKNLITKERKTDDFLMEQVFVEGVLEQVPRQRKRFWYMFC